jgi:uncharacterized protein (TIGR02147 family)
MQLLEANDSREFLKLALERIQTKHPQFGYAALVKKAGLASRSFPRDVILGKKSLTSNSARKLAQALSLTAELKQLFLLLVNLDESKKNQQPVEKIAIQIQKVKNRIRQKLEPKTLLAKNIFYEKKGWVEVWASLPAQAQNPAGISLEMILKRSGVSAKTVEKILNELLERALIAKNPETDGYFIQQSEHVIMDELGDNQFFKSWFLESIEMTKKNALAHFSSEHQLFLNSVLLVNAADMPRFKNDLRELIVRYVDQTENSNGDHLARISLSLF